MLNILGGISNTIDIQSIIKTINTFLDNVLFFKIFGFPFLILIAISCFIICNIMFNFVNIRLFKHSIDIVRDKYTLKNDPGTITHSQAIFTAALSSVGLGSVAGVSIAVGIGGPGAIFWLMIAGFLGMSAKFAEIALGHKYRHFGEDGVISGGPFLYIKKGMSDIGMPKIGVILGVAYALVMLLASFGPPNMFQTNQTAIMLSSQFPIFAKYKIIMSLFIVVPIAIVALADAKKIARLAGAVVPFMTIFYILSVFIALAVNYKNLGNALYLIVTDAFNPKSTAAGIVGSIVAGFTRAVFATETGGGTAAIAHAPSKTTEHIREGCTGFIEILLSLTVCFVTGLLLVVTKSNAEGVSGIILTSNAFKTVHNHFASILAIAVYFLAVTTSMGWVYFGSMSWMYLFEKKFLWAYKIVFLLFAWYGTVVTDVTQIVLLCDIVWSLAMVPNLLALVCMTPMIRKEMNDYISRYKNNTFKTIKK